MSENAYKNQNRHAYLIICHNNFEQLCLLLELLDHERNDIYIHVDKKVKEPPFDMLRAAVKSSGLEFVRRVDVAWGGYSMIQAEMALFEAAAPKAYAYCHLISGVDMPLKTQDEILSFFDSLGRRECVSFSFTQPALERVRYYYPVQELASRKKGLVFKLLRGFQRLFVKLQQMLGVNRVKGQEQSFVKGSQWVDISSEFAAWILSRRAWVEKVFKNSYCADELFVQSMVLQSPFKDRIYYDVLRFIDWERGMPYTFTAEDYELLTNSDMLFARKLDSNVDKEIVQRIYKHVKARQN